VHRYCPDPLVLSLPYTDFLLKCHIDFVGAYCGTPLAGISANTWIISSAVVSVVATKKDGSDEQELSANINQESHCKCLPVALTHRNCGL
jgi:hypothetical protein